MVKLVERLSPTLGADAKIATQAARLCKADLVSGMVQEFPELQGIMGGYYAPDEKIGAAIRDHYKPLGPDDALPATPEGCVVALADKIDTLVGFWSIDEKPTGSKDPYALRRAALGVIRIFLETNSRIRLLPMLRAVEADDKAEPLTQKQAEDLLGFIIERLKIYLRDTKNISPDIVQAIFSDSGLQRPVAVEGGRSASVGLDEIVTLVELSRALQEFMSSPDGTNLLIAYHRAKGILKKTPSEGDAFDAALFETDEERTLADAVAGLPEFGFSQTLKGIVGNYAAYLEQLAALREPVDTFFGAVMVNVDDAAIRNNRLALLKELVKAMERVGNLAEIKKI